MSNKINAGGVFPSMKVTALDGSEHDLSSREGDRWKMVVVYRGRHCPMCTRYLNNLEAHIERLGEIGVDVVAVSGDSRDQLQEHMEKLEVSIPLYYGLTLEQMQELGVYISFPRSPQETDHPFPEPGLFVINSDGQVQVVDLSNNPFVRPEPEVLTNGLAWIRDPENNYPIRGTWPDPVGQ